VAAFLDGSIYIQSSIKLPAADIAKRGHPLSRELVSLLRQGWDKAAEGHGFSVQRMSPRPNRYYLQKGANERVFFEGVSSKRTYRDLVGYATKRGVLRYWHYAISGKPEILPYPHLVIRGHVLFSDSGAALWTDAEKSAKARRNQCKGWWNDEWRDRMLAAMSLLKSDDGSIALPMSVKECVFLEAQPDTFESPVSYDGEKAIDEDLDDYYEGDDDEEEDEDLEGADLEEPTVTNS
jgi:hypothetical protein